MSTKVTDPTPPLPPNPPPSPPSAKGTSSPPRTLADVLAPQRRLRAVLGLNAITSLVTGVVGLAASEWWSARLGVDDATATRLVAESLIVFALAVASTAVTPARHLRWWAVGVSVVDLAWVGATVAVLVVGGLSGVGVVVGVVVGLGVLVYALAQLALARLVDG